MGRCVADKNQFAIGIRIGAPFKVEPRIDEPVAPQIMKTLLSIPEFVRAYEPDGMTPEEFDTYGATGRTLRGFLQADADLDALVRDVIMPQP